MDDLEKAVAASKAAEEEKLCGEEVTVLLQKYGCSIQSTLVYAPQRMPDGRVLFLTEIKVQIGKKVEQRRVHPADQVALDAVLSEFEEVKKLRTPGTTG